MRGPSTVWLVGMMGAGKSTVGRRLAVLLGRPFIDADAEIERAAGRSVPEIFASEGEAGFRAREREVVDSLLGSRAVVALGGGAVAQAALRRRLEGQGPLIHLRVSAETALARVGGGAGRPLLAGLPAEGRLERIRELLREREPAYGCADFSVDTETLDPDEAAEQIAARLAAMGVGSAEPPRGEAR